MDVAFRAFQLEAQHLFSPLRSCYPFAMEPRRVMAYMLVMAARKMCHPISVAITVIAHDGLTHYALLGWLLKIPTEPGYMNR